MRFQARAFVAVALFSSAVLPGSKAELLTFVDNPDPTTNFDRPFVALFQESSWFAAEAKAQAMGGHLIAIRSQEMNDWVNSMFSNFLGEQRSLWIGLNDVGSEGTFEWTDGTAFGYSNWFGSEPNNFGGREDSVLMLPGGVWNDEDGTRSVGFGVAVIAVPEPSVCISVVLIGLLVAARYRRLSRFGAAKT